MIPLDTWIDDAVYLSLHGYSIASWTDMADEDLPWLLLIHGFPTSSWDWTAIWPALRGRFNLAAIDMLGFGMSDKPASMDYQIATQADFQEAFLERLGVGGAHILAHDYGDTVAQELLARERDGALSFSIKSVCFLNGGLFPEQHRPLPIQKLGLSPLGPLVGAMMGREGLRRSLTRIAGTGNEPSAEEIDGHWRLINMKGGRRIFHRLLSYIPQRARRRARWVEAVGAAAAPICLIDGADDPVSGRHMHDHFRKLFPRHRAVLLEGVGHYPQTEAPESVVNAFLDFQNGRHSPTSTTSS